GLHHAGILVHDDHTARPQHGADPGQRVEIHGHVDFARSQHRAGGAARDDALQFLAAGNAAAYFLDHPAQRETHRQLVDARPVDVAAQAEQARPAVLGRAELGIRLRAHEENRRDVRERLDVVDDRRAAVEADHGREGRLDARIAAQALERIEQRRLLAALVGAGAGVGREVEIETRAQDVLPEVPALIGFLDGAIDDVEQVAIFTADVHIALVRPNREAANDDPLDHLVRVILHQGAVLAGAGFALVGVAHDILGLGDVLRHEAPLHAGIESRAAASAQAGVLDFVNDSFARFQLFLSRSMSASSFSGVRFS